MKYVITFLLIISITREQFAQHNTLHTQYMLNPVVLNPAYAGMEEALSCALTYRRQWMGFAGAPETYALSAHMPLRRKQFNVGLIAQQDNIAVLRRTQLELLYAYRLHAGKISLAAGFSPGVHMIQNNWSQVTTTDPGDMSYMGVERSIAWQAGFGFYASTKRAFLGLSSRALITKQSVLSPGEQPVLLYTGYKFGDPEKIGVTASALARTIPGNYFQADVNVLAQFRNLVGAGISYRIKDAVAGILSLTLNEQLHFGYSYDHTLSNIGNYSSGTHELLLRYDFAYRLQPKSPRKLY